MGQSKENYRVNLRITLDELENAISGTNINLSNGKVLITGVSTDSRQVKEGDLFFAIRGEKYDGHDFINEACKKGASLCIYERNNLTCRGIRVESSIKALGRLAKFYRTRFKGKVVAITGSNGKTTTKNIVASILSQMGRTIKSQGNFNNQLGLPLTILELDDEVKYLVLEIGMNHFGEIAYLADICKPNIGLITNIGPVHLEFLGDILGVAKAKKELFEALDGDSWAVINADDENIVKISKDLDVKKFRYSLKKSDSDLFVRYEDQVSNRGIKMEVKTKKCLFDATLPLAGSHNACNAAGAMSVATILGASEGQIKSGIINVRNDENRLEIIKLANEIYLVSDCYNANPVSTEAALRYVSKMNGKKYLVFGDMLELGEKSKIYHALIGRLAFELGFERIFLMGEYSTFIEKGALEGGLEESKITKCKSHGEIFSHLKKELDKRSVVLVKGSRGMRMEEVSKMLLNDMRGK